MVDQFIAVNKSNEDVISKYIYRFKNKDDIFLYSFLTKKICRIDKKTLEILDSSKIDSLDFFHVSILKNYGFLKCKNCYLLPICYGGCRLLRQKVSHWCYQTYLEKLYSLVIPELLEGL